MNAQQITAQALGYKSILQTAGVELTDHEHRMMNGLADYLAAQAQIQANLEHEVPAGTPFYKDFAYEDYEEADWWLSTSST